MTNKKQINNLENDIERYEYIINYFKENPDRVDENQKYIHNLFTSILGVSDSEHLHKDIKDSYNTLLCDLSLNIITKHCILSRFYCNNEVKN